MPENFNGFHLVSSQIGFFGVQLKIYPHTHARVHHDLCNEFIIVIKFAWTRWNGQNHNKLLTIGIVESNVYN